MIKTLPDHQIVVKLNKEQFEEAQKLAKIAGLRSATAYVRERVIEILKNPERLNELGKLANELPYRIRGVDNEIERIQRDLQQFIDESDYSSQSTNELKNETPDYQFEPEPLESSHSKDAEETIDLSSTIDSSLTEAVFDTTSNTIKNPVEASNYQSNEVEKNVWRSEPQVDKTDELEEEELQAALAADPVPGSSSDSIKEPEMQEVLDAVDEANDELEEMADRAFSISPRLGVIETTGTEEDDPLADLLDEHLIDKLVLPANQIVSEEPDSLSQEEANQWGTTAPPEKDIDDEPAPSTHDKDQKLEEKTLSEAKQDSDSGENPQASSTSPSEPDDNLEEKPKVEFETSENYDLDELKKLQEELNEVASGNVDDKKSDSDSEEEDEEPKFHDVSGGPPPKRRKN